MTIERWLQTAVEDAERRGLPELKTLLENFAETTRALRAANFSGSPLDFGRDRPSSASPDPLHPNSR
jgi:hypothetical protein